MRTQQTPQAARERARVRIVIPSRNVRYVIYDCGDTRYCANTSSPTAMMGKMWNLCSVRQFGKPDAIEVGFDVPDFSADIQLKWFDLIFKVLYLKETQFIFRRANLYATVRPPCRVA